MYTPNLADEYDLRGLRSELFDEGYMFSERWGQPLVVYADGSCLGNGRYQQASAGIGLFWGDCEQHFQRLPGSEQTNNRAELYALIRAIETCPYPRMRLEIRTDSKYAIGCATEWMHKWESNGFVNCKGYPVANKDLIMELSDLIDDRTARTTFIHVPGHSNDYGNYRADALARHAASC